MIEAAYLNPTAYGDFTGANFWVWVAGHLAVDSKFLTILAVLFGAGVLIMTERGESGKDGRSVAWIHYRRMAWLVVFGVLHGYLLSSGDILYALGLCGMVVFLLRRVGPKQQLLIGLGFICIPSVLSLLSGWSMPFWSPEERLQFEYETWRPTGEMIVAEVQAYRGSWLEQMAVRVPATFSFQTFIFSILMFWRVSGSMLIGMGLYKLGVLSARRSTAEYGGMMAVALFVGIPVTAYGIGRNVSADWDVGYSFFIGNQYNYWASLLVAGGWIGCVMATQRLGAFPRERAAMAAVGRMALTNYLMQSVICTSIFYGHGLGWFGSVERAWQMVIIFAVWGIELAGSRVWLVHFRFGPAEWLWRSLVHWCWQPMRRGGPGESPVQV